MMAISYVKSNATLTADGTTWASAYRTLAAAAGVDVAGDDIYISHQHTETITANSTQAWAGTLGNFVKIVCASDAAEPPTALSDAAQVTVSGSTTIAYNLNGNVYVRGVKFTSTGSGAVTLNFGTNTGAQKQIYEKCEFNLESTNTSSHALFGTNSAGYVQKTVLNDCLFANTGSQSHNHRIQNETEINGGALKAGGTWSNSGVFQVSFGGKLKINGFDFSAGPTSLSPVGVGSGLDAVRIVLRNCKLPTNWTGPLANNYTAGPASRIEMHNCDSADTNYRLWIEDYYGTVKHSTATYRDGGASDGTANFSWTMFGRNVNFPGGALASPEIARWNEAVGSALTVSVDIMYDGAGVDLLNTEAWIEVEYLGTSGRPLALFASTRCGLLDTPAALPASNATWTNGPPAHVKHKISATITPQEKGFIHVRVHTCKADTIHVDPMIQVS